MNTDDKTGAAARREREDLRLLRIHSDITRIAPTLNLHPAAIAAAAIAAAATTKGDRPSDADLRDALDDHRADHPTMYAGSDALTSGKTWTYNGKTFTRDQLAKMPAQQRLDVLNGSKGAKL